MVLTNKVISVTCIFGKGSPFSMSMFLNVIDEFLIFLWGPWTLLESIFFSRGLGHDEEDGAMTENWQHDCDDKGLSFVSENQKERKKKGA